MTTERGEAPPVTAFLRSRGLIMALTACLALDATILMLCPSLSGDCLYGFFTLIAFPVILSGPLGLTMPRLAAWAAERHWPTGVRNKRITGRPAEAAVWLVGLAALVLLITACHMIAIGGLNALDYGGTLIRPRLLQIGLGLGAAYYIGLGGISVAARRSRSKLPKAE